jgi:sulfur-oxidizing protein SoxZ
MFFLCSLWLQAENYRETKPEAWQATTIEDAMIKLYGTNKTILDNRVVLGVPEHLIMVSFGGSISLKISTTIPAKSIAVFHSSNSTALVSVFSIPTGSMVKYLTRFRIFSSLKTIRLVVVVEGLDGKLYRQEKEMPIAIPSCDDYERRDYQAKGEMKIRARFRNGKVIGKVHIDHAMVNYQEAKEKGLSANFITHVIAKVGDRVVYELSSGEFLAKTPLLKFKFIANRGELLTVTWRDLSGKSLTQSRIIQ